MIDITKPVRTRDGTPVEIISDKGREPYTLVGYIGNGRELDEWAADGAYLPGTKRNNDLENYEPEPWRLSDPPEGQKWHRDDWTEDMLPGGYRPLLLGETRESEDEFLFEPYGCASRWRISGGVPSCVNEADPAWCHHRTKRPLPEPKHEEWAAEKAAFAAGKAIQYRGSESSMWHDTVIPTWQFCCQYRIKPEPQWVQLGPKDVPCGSSVRMVSSQSGLEIESMVLRSSKNGIYICGQVGNIYEVGYDELFEDWQIKRPNEGWKPCKKEVQV
jgi:hypothetical protein